MIYRIILLSLSLTFHSSLAADISSLTALYNEFYHHHFLPRHCGRNIKNFLNEAQKRGIDLSDSSVLSLEGDGYWYFISAFYSRLRPNERTNLGRFHVIFVAEGYVFDFHLHEPLVLKFPEYVKLQLIPPPENQVVLGMNYLETGNPFKWTATTFSTPEFAVNHTEKVIWRGRLSDLISREVVEKTPRLR